MAFRRRRAREVALEVLYQVDLVQSDPDESLETAIAKERLPDLLDLFARELVTKTLANLNYINETIVKFADNWSLERMATLDRCILRLAISEFLFFSDIPINVTINEAVEMAKKYSTERSSEFVNGILDKIRRELNPKKEEPSLSKSSSEKPTLSGVKD